MVKSRYHYHFKRSLHCRWHFVLRLSERSFIILERTCRIQLWESSETCYLCGMPPTWVFSKINNWGQFYIFISEDVKMKQEAKQVDAFQNHFVPVCSDVCKHKQSQNIQRFLPFFSHRFFVNPMNTRDPLPRNMSTHTHTKHMHTGTCIHSNTHTTHTRTPKNIFGQQSTPQLLPKFICESWRTTELNKYLDVHGDRCKIFTHTQVLNDYLNNS